MKASKSHKEKKSFGGYEAWRKQKAARNLQANNKTRSVFAGLPAKKTT